MSYFIILHVLRLSFLGTEDNLLMEESAQILEVETFIPMLLQNAENGVSRHVGDTAIGEADLNCSTSNMFKADHSYSAIPALMLVTFLQQPNLSSGSCRAIHLPYFFVSPFPFHHYIVPQEAPNWGCKFISSPVQSISVLPQSSMTPSHSVSAQFSLPIAFMPVCTCPQISIDPVGWRESCWLETIISYHLWSKTERSSTLPFRLCQRWNATR